MRGELIKRWVTGGEEGVKGAEYKRGQKEGRVDKRKGERREETAGSEEGREQEWTTQVGVR